MDDKQRHAAQLLGRGWTVGAVADEVGVGTATIQRWKKLDDVQAEMKAARDEYLSDPTVRKVLNDALVATKANGVPDWPTRLGAARLLLQAPPEDEPDAPTVFTIYEPRSAG